MDKKVFEGRTYYRMPSGYYNDGSNRYLHRDIWASVHGPIPEGYDIHHKDFDRGNNSIENLQIVLVREHRLLHSGRSWASRRKNPLKKTCAECGEKYQAMRSDSTFCSKRCRLKNYYQRNRDALIMYGRAWRVDNKEHTRAYYLTHKAEILAKKAKARKEGQ
jgi:predicted nucleic acid-binding Zn ribbon protein